MSELEQMAQLLEETFESYKALIDGISQYAIEFEEAATLGFRAHLGRVASLLGTPKDRQVIYDSRSHLRAELRDYRDRAMSYLADLHRELSEKTETLQHLLDAMSAAEDDHDEELREQLAELRKLAAAAGEQQAAILAVAQGLEKTIEQIHQHNQLMIAQFLVEIRQLHKRIETLERAAEVDSSSQAYSRRETESRIQGMIGGESGFSLLVFRLENLAAIERDYGLPLAGQLIKAFVRRLRNALPPATVIGCWSADQFVVILEIPKTDAIARSRPLIEKLSGIYVFAEEGLARKIALQANVAVIYAPPSQEYGALLETVERLSFVPAR